jgi:hypothetical protein
LKTLSDLWTGTLLPAITAVWSFIDTKVLPILRAIGDLINATLVVAFKLIAGTLTTTVIPALEKMYTYFNANILPVLTKVADGINRTLGPAFAWLGTQLKPIIDYLASLLSNIQGVVTWLENLANKLNSISIPDWAGGGGGGNKNNSANRDTGSNTLIRSSRASVGTQSVLATGGGDNYHFYFADSVSAYDRDRLTRETKQAMDSAGLKAYNRMRTGN